MTYVTMSRRPASWMPELEDWSQTDRPTCTVYEDDEDTTDTGLVDCNGTTIYRLRERVPMGFQAPSCPPKDLHD